MRIKTSGMVLGKFLPLHKGHVYLIEFALRFVDELTVVVGTLKDEPISGKVRFDWVKEMFPQVNVVHLQDENPQQPEEHPDFWDIWKTSLERILPKQPDYVFASESYGQPLAKILNADFIPCDESRSLVPISGTEIRKNPYLHRDYIPRIVRPYFIKRICIFGPESTGKSTLTKQLAAHYQTNHVSEYARTYLEAKQKDPTYDDMELIGRGQKASMEALLFESNKLIFSDTDIMTTQIWSRWMFAKHASFFDTEVQHFDLYLLLDVDLPWADDAIRYYPERRKEFYNDCQKVLEEAKVPYERISGFGEKRLQNAIAAVDRIFDEEIE